MLDYISLGLLIFVGITIFYGITEMANDTHYGLAAYVYTENLSVAMKMFEGLRFGIIGINDINPTAASAPLAA